MTITAEWAVAPLNDPANVGRKVYLSWNHNRSSEAVIESVTAKSIRLGNGRTSYRVSDDGHTARTPPSANYPGKVTTFEHYSGEQGRLQRRSTVTKALRDYLSDEKINIIGKALGLEGF